MIEIDEQIPFELVSKLDAAKRQLKVAVRLFFERKDLIAIHTLAAAAQEILIDLGRPQGIKSIFKGSTYLKPEYQKEFEALFRGAQNFFKHADRDPEEKLKFYFKATKFFILDAAILYKTITNTTCPEIVGFMSWISVKHPHLLFDGPYKDIVLKMRRKADPDDFNSILLAIDNLAISMKDQG
jgi:hypothetical protein